MKSLTFPQTFALIASLTIATCWTATAEAQRAGSWVDIARGGTGSGASADGVFKFARSDSRSNGSTQFGHGFAVGAGPEGIALSNSIGGGAGPLGAAHNLQLNVGREGTHLSHGGVVSQGGERRVFAGGETGSHYGQPYGGSQVGGYGHHTNAYSNSHTQPWRSRPAGGPGSTWNPGATVQPSHSLQPAVMPPTYQPSGMSAPMERTMVMPAAASSNRGGLGQMLRRVRNR